MFVRLEDCPFEDLGGGVRRRMLAHGGGLMQVEVQFDEGAVGPMHSHPHEQLTYVLSGEFEFTIGGETRVVRAGDTLYKRPGIEHGCVCRRAGGLRHGDLAAELRLAGHPLGHVVDDRNRPDGRAPVEQRRDPRALGHRPAGRGIVRGRDGEQVLVKPV